MIKWLLLLIPLFGPSLLWLGWQAWRLKKAQAAGIPIEDEDGGPLARLPVVWLAPLSGVLFVVMLIAFGVLNRASPDSVYEPSRLIDGEVVPGRLSPEEP